jgi:hypothetical protein
MIRTACFISVILLTGATGTSYAAGDSQEAWIGVAQVTLSTAACAGVGGTAVGSSHISVYRPKIKSTDSITYLSIIGFEAALTLGNESETTAPQMHGSGTYKGSAIDRRALPFSYTAGYNFMITPAPLVTATTAVVTITGTVDNYFNNAGCNVTFTATYGPLK